MVKKQKLHTGQKIEVSGIYQISGKKDQLTLVKGDRIPPYSGKAVKVKIVKKTIHKK